MKQLSTDMDAGVPGAQHHSNWQLNLFNWFRFLLLIGSTTIFAGSCQKSNNHIKKTVPLNAEFQDSVTLIVPGSPHVLEQAHVSGWGSGTPIGKSTFEDNIFLDVTVSPEIINGVDTIITEDGDKIFSTFNGYSPDPDKLGNYEVFNKDTISGGTGKFAGASGNYTVKVKGNFSLPTETTTYTGTITY